jgi:hypothetical protein
MGVELPFGVVDVRHPPRALGKRWQQSSYSWSIRLN